MTKPIPEATGRVTDVLHRRPLPSFDQWLQEKGDGTRGDGFEAFEDLAKRTHAADVPAHLKPDELAFLRVWMGMQLAIIELGRIEYQHGRAPAEIIITLGRVLGAAAVYSVASVAKDDAPIRRLAKILLEEFRFGANTSADQIEASR